MRNAFAKDVGRLIVRSGKRFLSLVVITVLGVTVMAGITAACQDMYYSADKFYDEQNLFDIRVLSTLGLTEDDVDALAQVEGIAMTAGGYSETVYTKMNDIKYTAEMVMISEKSMNMPYVVEGNLPEKAGEAAVTQKYLDDTGKSLGDRIIIEEDIEIKEEKEEEDVIEEEEDTPTFLHTEYTITAVVIDPMDIANNDAAFRSSSTAADYNFFITPDNLDTDIYTCVYITLDGMTGLNCYSDEYEEAVKAVIRTIEAEIMEQREIARYESIHNEAFSKIEDAETEMKEEFSDAEAEIADAWEEIEEGRQELADGEAELIAKEKDALQKIADAKTELADGEAELTQAQTELDQGVQDLEWAKMELSYNEWVLSEARAELEKQKKLAGEEFAKAEQELAERQSELDSAKAALEAGVTQLKASNADLEAGWPQNEWDALVSAAANKTVSVLGENPDLDTAAIAAAVAADTTSQQTSLGAQVVAIGMMLPIPPEPGYWPALAAQCTEMAIGLGVVNGSQQILNEGRSQYQSQKEDALQKLADAEAEILSGERQIEEGWEQMAEAEAELEEGKQELLEAWTELEEGKAELAAEEEKAKKEIADAWQELEEGKQELADGELELVENEEEYYKEKEDAEQKISDAYVKLDDIDMAQWYVQDRMNLESYSSLKSDMSSIESIGGVFPIVFLVVAILISLTTMTRMIEEERGLLGTYKALGFGNGAIYFKYIWYAMFACILGGVIGDICGFIVLPKFLLYILQSLYVLPHVVLRFDVVYGIGGILLFMVGIVGATFFVCRSELKQTPSSLMRPKAPRRGSRVFLEHIPFIWSRLKFLNKVTVRNLFRYKKRFFMTVFGIVGCTALIVAGFAIKDSVTALVPKQYDRMYQYDLMVAAAAEDNDELISLFAGDEYVKDYINIETSSMKLYNEQGESEGVQLIVVPESLSLDGYIELVNVNGESVSLDETGAMVTRNAAQLLGIQAGENVTIQTLALDRAEANVSAVVENYLGNNIYMTQKLYEDLLGEYKPNGAFVHLSETCSNQREYAEGLLDFDIVLSSISIATLRAEFSSNFALVNSVVYLLIILAAGLAFVVLFTLSNTNISERIRELATTKVLGFYDKEVHSYVNKETLILTGIGIALGLPVGWYLSSLLTNALKMPSIYFETYVAPVSYAYAALISLCFTLIVNILTNRTLNRINMVEALKSVE